MPFVKTNSDGEIASQLFKRCRHALGLTVNEMQDELLILNRQSILRIEEGQIDVQGPTWVALWYLLDEKLEEGNLPQNADEIERLMDEIESFADEIKKVIQTKRDKIYGPRNEAQES